MRSGIRSAIVFDVVLSKYRILLKARRETAAMRSHMIPSEACGEKDPAMRQESRVVTVQVVDAVLSSEGAACKFRWDQMAEPR